MAAFILRRLGVLGVILFGSSFILYNLAAISGDPLEQLKMSSDPNRDFLITCLLYTSPSPRDRQKYRMPSSA